jgi:hypothetical protein
MALEPEITKALDQMSRLVERTLKTQAPYKTGTLRDSIKVTGKETPNGNLVLNSSYERYGTYLDYGTGRYNKYPNRGAYNPRPGKGTGGIKPRFWTTLPDTVKERIKMIIQKATGKMIASQFRRANRK